METTNSVISLIVLLLFTWIAIVALGIYMIYHFRFIVDCVSNKALGSGRLLWLLFLLFLPPFADALYFAAVWSKQPKPTLRRWIRDMKMNKVAVGCGSILLVVIVIALFLLTGIGIALEQGFLPDNLALPKGSIPSRQLERLVNNGIVERGEEVEFFYSAAIFSIDGNGNLFTDTRVISYQKGKDSFDVCEAYYEEIEDIEFTKSSSWAYDSTIRIMKKYGDWFSLVVSPDEDRDELFYEVLASKWQSQHEANIRPSRVDKTETEAPADGDGVMTGSAYLVLITSFDPQRKITGIKRIREVTGYGLAKAKMLIENCPSEIMNGMYLAQARELSDLLEGAGMLVEIQIDDKNLPVIKNLEQIDFTPDERE